MDISPHTTVCNREKSFNQFLLNFEFKKMCFHVDKNSFLVKLFICFFNLLSNIVVVAHGGVVVAHGGVVVDLGE